jgi:ElaB/YqjD/DUF883 family membrane-anchored ribosome-binding protein
MVSRIESTSTAPRNESTQTLVEEVKEMLQRAEEKAVERAKAADRAVRDHPYPALGLAFGVGLFIGMLIKRRHST